MTKTSQLILNTRFFFIASSFYKNTNSQWIYYNVLKCHVNILQKKNNPIVFYLARKAPI